MKANLVTSRPAAALSTAGGPRIRLRTAGRWVLQIALAAPIAIGGIAKLTGDPQMTAMFSTLGAEPWLRIVIGVLELLGAVGLLIPRTAVWAATGLAVLLAGASFTNVALLHTSPVLPLVFFAIAVSIVLLRRRELTTSIRERR
ncbi:DoxX family protein [Kribbella italica]|uniref:Putative membrane protein YphA (DoxX/SURF4 family) n=1 Tax=Kribbella italica TaxID=1540520 RepID=A0A7W9MUB5_9ACTN|nr:DoxX family protein [Kribbella italica]MBB5836057.1 putative membrane protein YphA (DoxX/SURF4 family) [Kribbella italica]